MALVTISGSLAPPGDVSNIDLGGGLLLATLGFVAGDTSQTGQTSPIYSGFQFASTCVVTVATTITISTTISDLGAPWPENKDLAMSVATVDGLTALASTPLNPLVSGAPMPGLGLPNVIARGTDNHTNPINTSPDTGLIEYTVTVPPGTAVADLRVLLGLFGDFVPPGAITDNRLSAIPPSISFDDAACATVAVDCVGEATHLDDCGVSQWSELLQQTVDALRPEVRWSSICDDGVPGVTAWQKWSSVDNGLTWTLLGTFTEQYGAVPYVPVGVLVDCCDIGVAPTGKRARRAVLGVGSTVAPTGLPSPGALVESLSWSSRNATGTITDTAGTVSSFVAGEGGTWELEWIDTMTFDVTTGEVVIDWIEVY